MFKATNMKPKSPFNTRNSSLIDELTQKVKNETSCDSSYYSGVNDGMYILLKYLVERGLIDTRNPDQRHFDAMLLKELAFKLDREVWAHVPNPEPGEPWTQSKAREVTRDLIKSYIGDLDKAKARITELEEQINWQMQFVPGHERPGFQEPTVNNEII